MLTISSYVICILCISCALLYNIRRQQSNQKSIAERDESKTTSDTRGIDSSKKDSPFTDKSSADKSISIATHAESKSSSTARKKNSKSFVDLPLGKSITEDCDNDISNEDVQGDYDVPIAERLKLRREKRKAETNSTAKTATYDNIGTPIAERLKRRRTNNNAPDTAQQETFKSKTTRKRKASSLDSNEATEMTTPKSSKKKTCASKEDFDYSKTGIRASGNKWSVEIGYHKKRCYPGSYEDKEHAVLANKVAREFLLATRDLQLTDEEIQRNIDFAKEAALKAVNELLAEDGGASDSISEEEEDKQPLEEEDNTSATTTSDGISIDREKHIQSKITHRRQLLTWVKAARLACEKNMVEQPDFIQETLKSYQAHSSSAQSTASVSGEFASEVANYQALTNTANSQQSSTEKTDVKTVGVYRVSNGWVCHCCWFYQSRFYSNSMYLSLNHRRSEYVTMVKIDILDRITIMTEPYWPVR